MNGTAVKSLGQVFTPANIVTEMLRLRRRRGRTLEPSAGDGAFSRNLPGCTAIEFDATVAGPGMLRLDFFELDEAEQFDSIIGNPPYVRAGDILPGTLAKIKGKGYLRAFDNRTNLYIHFIRKCLEHLAPGGELIFITPREFLNATSGMPLNETLFKTGTITDLVELGDRRVFPTAAPNCVIWRFEKDNFSRRTTDGRRFILNNGCLLFTERAYPVPFSEVFFVKVGAVSGLDRVFRSPAGNRDFVTSETVATGRATRMFYNVAGEALAAHKPELLGRKIRRFTDANWFKWGRELYESDAPRIYVNCKTRARAPFYTHACRNFDGSVLGVFPRAERPPLRELANLLNQVDWRELGFVCGGRRLFSQRALEGTLLPASFAPWREAARPRPAENLLLDLN